MSEQDIGQAKFTRKPFEVDAIQVTEGNIDLVATWCEGEVKEAGEDQKPSGRYIQLKITKTLRRKRHTQAFVGDWVTRAVGGHFRGFSDGAFRKTFEVA